MALDSLGLGLTLDTSLLEKADKTLENMHKNSKLIMQNLERGFTAFNSGGADAMTKLSKGLGHVSEALDKIDKAEVSPDFDTKGQEKYIGRMQHLLDMVEKLSKTRGAKFYDPTEVYVTDKTPDKISGEIAEVREHKEELSKLLEVIEDYNTLQKTLQKTINKTDNELAAQNNKLKVSTESYRKLREEQEKADKALQSQYKRFATIQLKKDSTLAEEDLALMFTKRTEDPSDSMNKYAVALSQANEKLKKEKVALEETLNTIDELEKKNIDAKKEYQKNLNIYQNREQIKSSYDILKEEEKILKSELEFSRATQAERAAMLTKRNEEEIKADQKRIKDVQKNYEQLRKEIQKGEQEIAELEAVRETFKEANRPTKGVDSEIKKRRVELNKLMQDELEFRSSQYWPKLQAIDEKFNSKAFIKNQKELAKLAAKESRKDVTAALQYSRNAQSINEEKEAIKRLIEARDNLSTSTSRYSKTVKDINKRILAHKDHIEAVTRVEKEQNTLADSVINRYRKQLKALDEVNEALEKKTQIEHKASVADLDKTDADTASLLARQKTIADDIAAIEKQAQGELDVIKEQHEAERAKKKIDETIRLNEREKQEYAKLLDEKYALEKQKRAMEAAGAKVGDKSYDYMLAQEKELDKKILQLEQKHQGDIAEIHLKHLDKKNQDEVREFIATQKEKQRIAEKTQKEIDAYNEKYGTTSKRNAEMAITSFSGAQNINQHKQAIEGLQQVRARLDNTDKDYYKTLKQLNQAIHSHELYIRAAENESTKLTNSHRGLMDISGQLMRRLALAFSVSQMTQYFKKLVEVRGQFEKTEVALTSIIGDGQKAQKLMNQTISLAVKSPFTLQQLTSYTKQLAAYQVSYEELHSTTKMLADVSAGLGVEMDRLILAFGQVKAANYLRATEVRQFTEAGFNILEELAKYYTKIDGINVTVGEVQDKVTKRMVSFEDVAEVFKRVTQEGSRFYEMQSKQAETLAGQWTNLQDRIDIMLNEIGTSGEGVLKGLVKFLASAIDNWEVFASSLKTAVSAFVIFKAYSLLAGDGLKLLAIDMGVLTCQIPKVMKLGDVFKTLARVVKSAVSNIGASMSTLLTNPIFLAVAALGTLLTAGAAWLRHHKQMREALAEQDKVLNENTSSLQRLNEKYKEASKSSGEYKKKLELLRELSNNLKDRNLTLSVKIEEVDETNIDEVFEENSKRLQKAYDLGRDLGQAIAKGMNEAQGNLFGFSLFGENLKEDAEDYGQSMGNLMSWGMQVQMKNIEDAARINYKQMGKYAQEYYDSIKGGKGKFESEYEWTKRRATALVMISKLEEDIVGKNKELQKTLRSVVADGIELHHETKGVYDNLVEAVGGLGNLRKEAASNPIELAAQIKTEVDKLDYDPATKQFIINDLYAMLHLRVNYVEDPNATPTYDWSGFKKDLKDSREDLKAFKDAKGEGLGYENFFFSENEIKQLGKFSDALEAIQKKYDENKKTIEQLSGTSDEYSKEERKRLEALQAELKEVAAKWNYDLDAKNKKGDSEALKRLKDQIKLIKEANKAYEERNKKFGKEESKAVVSESYKDAFKEVELAIEDIDYTNLEGVVAALERLEEEAKKAGGQVELLKALSEVRAQIGLTFKERQDRELFDQVQEIFDDYELAVDIKKLNIPQDLAKNLFGIDTKSFDQMRSEIISKFAGTNKEVSDILSKGTTISVPDEQKLIDAIGKDAVDKAKEALGKIDDLEEQSQLDRLKKYLEYTRAAIGERAKIKVEEMNKLMEIDETFTKAMNDAETEEDKKRIAEQRKLAEAGVKKEASDKTQQLDWDAFKSSDTFVSIFEDLENVSDSLLNHAIDKIKEFQDSWKDMPISDAKEMISKLNELELALLDTGKPFADYRQANKDIKNAMMARQIDAKPKSGKSQEELRTKLGDENKEMEAIIANALIIESVLQTINNATGENKQEQLALVGITSDYVQSLGLSEDVLTNTAEKNGEIARQERDKAIEAKKNIGQNDKILKQLNTQKSRLEQQADAISSAQKMANDLYDVFKGLSEALGGDSDSPAAIFADMGMNMLNTVLSTIQLQLQLEAAKISAEGLSVAMNSAMGVVGWIVMGIQLVVQGINAIVQASDKKVDAQVEKLIANADELNERYEKLADSVDEIYNVRELEETSRQLDILYEKEKKAIEAAIAARKADKNISDDEWEEIADLERRLVEMEETHADNIKNVVSQATDGIFDSIKDAAREFTDAWYDAFVETGDGLSGLEENFNELFMNLAKNQAAMQITDIFVKRWKDALATYVNEKDTELSPEDAIAFANDVKATFPELNAALEGFLGVIHEALGTVEGGELSSLQKGIQGITEDQADILAAYWNSVRGYTASIDSKMDMILANLNVSAEDNPMLAQLMMVAKNTSAINTLLSSLVKSGHTLGGSGIKVFMS